MCLYLLIISLRIGNREEKFTELTVRFLIAAFKGADEFTFSFLRIEKLSELRKENV